MYACMLWYIMCVQDIIGTLYGIAAGMILIAQSLDRRHLRNGRRCFTLVSVYVCVCESLMGVCVCVTRQGHIPFDVRASRGFASQAANMTSISLIRNNDVNTTFECIVDEDTQP